MEGHGASSSSLYARLRPGRSMSGAWDAEDSDDETPKVAAVGSRDTEVAQASSTALNVTPLASATSDVPTRSISPVPRQSEASRKGKERAAVSPTEQTSTEQPESNWQCHICLEEASDAVVTHCGHLCCWADLIEWWDSNPTRPQTCPVCKAPSGSDKVVPIYGRGREEVDPRSKRKPRPRPVIQRPRLFSPGGGPNNGVQFHANMFPFPGLGFSWQSGGMRGAPTDDATAERMQGLQPAPPIAMLQLIGFLLMLSLFSSLLLA